MGSFARRLKITRAFYDANKFGSHERFRFTFVDGKQLPTELQQVTVQVQRNDECKKSYDTEAPGGITDKMLCAAYPNKDSCMVVWEFSHLLP